MKLEFMMEIISKRLHKRNLHITSCIELKAFKIIFYIRIKLTANKQNFIDKNHLDKVNSHLVMANFSQVDT